MKKFVTSIFIFMCVSQPCFAQERSLLFKCAGKVVQTSSDGRSFSPDVNIEDSFFIGAKFVETAGKKYQICSDLVTQIGFADNCKKASDSGTYDYLTKRMDRTVLNAKFKSESHYILACTKQN